MVKNDDIQIYLQGLAPAEQRVLKALRNQLLRICPTLEERLSRGVPFFYYNGKRAVGFRSSKKHLSFFIMEGNALKTLQKEVEGYDVSSTVVRFTVAHPLPEAVVEKLTRARIGEIEHALGKKVQPVRQEPST